ncbi:MAG: threonine/serine exporter family protein [Anaerovoracaceae bacterium]
MITQKQKRALVLAVRAGEILMKNGAEIYRVEEVITRICHACEIPYVEVFATPTGIFTSIGTGGADGETETYIKAIKSRTTDLEKISKVNSFSRRFTTTVLSVEDGMKELTAIDNEKPFCLGLRLFGASFVAALFAMIFGGQWQDGLCAGVIGPLSYLLSLFLAKHDVSYFIQDFFCCALASLLALTAETLGLTGAHDHIIIGVLMIFVPGAAFTNSLRDFLSGDMLSGVARLTEALAIAISLAAGAGFVLKIWGSLVGLIGGAIV